MSDPERLQIVIVYARIIFPFVAFMSMTAIYGSVLNANNRWQFASSPFWGNSFIVGAVLLCSLMGAPQDAFDIGYVFAWAILLSGAVQFLVVLIDAWRQTLLLRVWSPYRLWQSCAKWPKDWSFFKRLMPAAMGQGLRRSTLIGLLIAARLPVGSISFLNYADRLYWPLSVLVQV